MTVSTLEPHPGSPARGLQLYVLCPCWILGYLNRREPRSELDHIRFVTALPASANM